MGSALPAAGCQEEALSLHKCCSCPDFLASLRDLDHLVPIPPLHKPPQGSGSSLGASGLERSAQRGLSRPSGPTASSVCDLPHGPCPWANKGGGQQEQSCCREGSPLGFTSIKEGLQDTAERSWRKAIPSKDSPWRGEGRADGEAWEGAWPSGVSLWEPPLVQVQSRTPVACGWGH